MFKNKKMFFVGALACFAAALLLISFGMKKPAQKETVNEPVKLEPKDVVVLYTNDVHCRFDGYSRLAALRRQTLDAGFETLVVDAGDNLQGEIIGTLTKGDAIVELMNAVPYDLAVPGNHEFDFGLDTFLKYVGEKMKYPEVSSNFTDLRSGKLVFPAYKLFTLGGRRVAFVGVTTPSTMTSSTPTYFQDKDGKQIYSFAENDICAKVQEAVDAARGEGAQVVILVSHLGVNGVEEKWSAPAVITGTRGIDAVIDGHSHEVFAGEVYKNADGKDVRYTQTGTKFMFVGKMMLKADGSIATEMIHTDEIKVDESEPSKRDFDAVEELAAKDRARIEWLQQKVGVAEVNMTTFDPRTGERRVRLAETNMADFAADANRIILGAQIGIINGGGVRADISAGDVTRLDLMNIYPWPTPTCVVELPGGTILDMLEFAARRLPDTENGGFLHVSGLSYEIDATIPSPVKLDDKGVFAGIEPDKPRRVGNVRVDGMPLDPEKSYTVGGINYILLDGGDGFGSSAGLKVVKQDGLPNQQEAIIKFFEENLHGRFSIETYGNPVGAGRSVIKK